MFKQGSEMTTINQIPNPYIVGNPIKTKKMFYGRDDEFDFIKRKLDKGSKSHLLVLCGERDLPNRDWAVRSQVFE